MIRARSFGDRRGNWRILVGRFDIRRLQGDSNNQCGEKYERDRRKRNKEAQELFLQSHFPFRERSFGRILIIGRVCILENFLAIGYAVSVGVGVVRIRVVDVDFGRVAQSVLIGINDRRADTGRKKQNAAQEKQYKQGLFFTLDQII